MQKHSKRQILTIFKNNRYEFYHPDGSVLHWKNIDVTYISPKGIKGQIPINQICKAKDVQNKFKLCLCLINTYASDHIFITLEQSLHIKDDENWIKKGFKISEFKWENPQIEEMDNGYQIKSDCGFARLTLESNLYTVQVSYLQLIKSSNQYLTKKPNMTKMLLQKYDFQYTEFPLKASNDKPQFYYLEHTKVFNIFNIANQWKFALNTIWKSLISYEVIPHQFLFINYDQKELCSFTPMPQVKSVEKIGQQLDQSTKKQETLNMPILGKINHFDECIFAKIESNLLWFQKEANFMYDSIGFWFYESFKFGYKKANKVQNDQQFNVKAVPYLIRFQNEKQRYLQNELKVLVSYCEQNERVRIVNAQRNKGINTVKFDNENNLVSEQQIQNIGNFKAYSNGVVIAKYKNGGIATLNSKRMEIKIIGCSGQSAYIDLHNRHGISYQQNKGYVLPVTDFQERTFYPQIWISKQRTNQQIQAALEVDELFKKINQHYLKL